MLAGVQVSNVTEAVTSQLKQLNATALLEPTMGDLADSFSASVNFTSAPSVSANLAGAGSNPRRLFHGQLLCLGCIWYHAAARITLRLMCPLTCFL